MGIGPREAPGLFRRGGRTAVNNLPVSEHPLFRDHGDPQTGYIQPQAILDALRDEYFGQPRRTDDQRDAETRQLQAEEEQRACDEIVDVAREHGLERDEAVIDRALLLYAEGHLSPDDAVERAAIELEDETTTETDRLGNETAGIPFGAGDAGAVEGAGEALSEAVSAGAAGTGEKAARPAGEPRAGDRQDAQPPRTEPGADGRPQLTIPGTEPISEAQVGQRCADEPLRPGVAQQPMDEGLFGEPDIQADLLDTARQPERAPDRQSVEGQRQIGTNEDGHPLFEDENGVRSFVRDGLRISETVQFIPTRGGPPTISVDPSSAAPFRAGSGPQSVARDPAGA